MGKKCSFKYLQYCSFSSLSHQLHHHHHHHHRSRRRRRRLLALHLSVFVYDAIHINIVWHLNGCINWRVVCCKCVNRNVQIYMRQSSPKRISVNGFCGSPALRTKSVWIKSRKIEFNEIEHACNGGLGGRGAWLTLSIHLIEMVFSCGRNPNLDLAVSWALHFDATNMVAGRAVDSVTRFYFWVFLLDLVDHQTEVAH